MSRPHPYSRPLQCATKSARRVLNEIRRDPLNIEHFELIAKLNYLDAQLSAIESQSKEIDSGEPAPKSLLKEPAQASLSIGPLQEKPISHLEGCA